MSRHSLKQQLKFSPLGRCLALPMRLRSAAWPLVRQGVSVAKWWVTSREWANLTYNYQPLGLDAVVAAVSVLTGAKSEALRRYAQELKADETFRERFESRVRSSSLRFVCDPELRFGRCLVNYLLVRAVCPRHVFEAGTEHGLSTWAMCRAIQANGEEGSPPAFITTVDLTSDRGGFLDGDEGGTVRRLTGDSVAVLRRQDEPIDLFLHDTSNDPDHSRLQLDSLITRLAPGALVHSCWFSSEFVRFCELNRLAYLEYVERVEDHWYPGRRCGLAKAPGGRELREYRDST